MSMSHMDEGTLHAYIDGELPPAEAQAVAEHLAHCPVCRARVEEERALIARADQVLARARPPERDLPAFRADAPRPPVRRWWRVRVPLAWAATVVLALGMGIYVGRAGTGRPIAPGPAASPMPLASAAPVADSPRVRLQQPVVPRAAAQAARAAHPVRAIAPAPQELATRDAPASAVAPPRDKLAAKTTVAAEADRALDVSTGARVGAVVVGAPLSLDSARALLDAEPLAVPGLPVRAIHRGQMRGYSAVVVVEQVLDSGTTLAVITARPRVMALDAVVETGAAGAPPAAGASPTERVAKARERVQDSLQLAAPQPRAPVTLRSDSRRAGLWFDVRGPLSADSLASLGRRLEPVQP